MLTEQKIARIIELHKTDMPIDEIASQFEVAPVTMKRWISRIRQSYDLPYRSKSKQKVKIERAMRDDEETPWNLHLSRQYITSPWGMA